MAHWPTAADLIAWGHFADLGLNASDGNVVASVAAANELVRNMLDDRLLPPQPGSTPEPDPESVCPPSVHSAVLIQAARIYARRDSPVGTTGTDEILLQIRKLDPDVEVLIEAYRLPTLITGI